MMNTLLLANSYLPHAGGSRVYYHNLLKQLAIQHGDQVTVLTTKVPGREDFDRAESSDLFRILRHSKPYPKALIPFVLGLREILGGRIDLVQVGDLFPQGILGLLLKRLTGVPYVVFCHGEEITLTEQYRLQPLLRNRIYREADALVAACEFAKQHLLRLGIPEERICKINPGVDWRRFSPQQKDPELTRRFSLQNKTVLLTVSRLRPRKGHDITMRAIASIAREIPDLRYVIVGRGGEEERLRRLAADLDLNSVVHFAGYVPEDQLCQFYNLADIFVMPNREEAGDIEGFAMVFLEASAVGKPVIGGRSGGTYDSILDGITGFLVNPEDVDELAGALKRMIQDPALRRRMGAAGLDRARTEFGWEVGARRLHELGQNVVACARASQRSCLPALQTSLPARTHSGDHSSVSH
jgi:phosphatidylinositol alpha-1,6-mannosyltransferase